MLLSQSIVLPQLIVQNVNLSNAFGGNYDENALLIGVFKLLFILVAAFYVLFAVIVVRQVQIMKNTLITPVSPILLVLSILHLLLAIGVLLLFIVIL